MTSLLSTDLWLGIETSAAKLDKLMNEKKIIVTQESESVNIPIHYYWKIYENLDYHKRMGQGEYRIRKILAESKEV